MEERPKEVTKGEISTRTFIHGFPPPTSVALPPVSSARRQFVGRREAMLSGRGQVFAQPFPIQLREKSGAAYFFLLPEPE